MRGRRSHRSCWKAPRLTPGLQSSWVVSEPPSQASRGLPRGLPQLPLQRLLCQGAVGAPRACPLTHKHLCVQCDRWGRPQNKPTKNPNLVCVWLSAIFSKMTFHSWLARFGTSGLLRLQRSPLPFALRPRPPHAVWSRNWVTAVGEFSMHCGSLGFLVWH